MIADGKVSVLLLELVSPLLDYKAFNYSALVKSWDLQSKANVDIDFQVQLHKASSESGNQFYN